MSKLTINDFIIFTATDDDVANQLGKAFKRKLDESMVNKAPKKKARKTKKEATR